ncbi:endoplasmic reticulum aminopeptidase 2 [Hypanus sabinus]|uniref:endoplasmic reticulum aminopeptidase 2 n=1 Tax=Hypanus sabinus TaxID=79690 RepID=UPI0028C3FC3F|nr:endoplasmic reticulum aminopeptidase 2 [Hypanus sabinus]XP_059825426.1 endoplasmic reticulum aminopeptidase 2 [Hypanus sabinus]
MLCKMMLSTVGVLIQVILCLGDQENKYFPSATNGQMFPWNKMRLPDKIVPLHYELQIHPNLTTSNFTGLAKIQILVRKETSTIILHAKNMDISGATIALNRDGVTYPESTLNILEYPPFEQIALKNAEPLSRGETYVVNIYYAANLSDGFSGFYKSSYETLEGEKRLLATTQFETTSARMAFPCFDEPAFKANFSIRIKREQQHIALSNMPIIKSLPTADGLFEDHFDVSVRMSTYLVAFIVCDFKSISAVTSTGIKVSVYAAPDKLSQTHYALEVAVKQLEFYEHYFNIRYPLPKSDLVALPYFDMEAMENWGLITYRQTALLYHPATSSVSDKLWITRAIGHELAHQWFGNLVTMEWWNDLWLNEGFASYMEYVSVDATYPDLQVGVQLLGSCFSAMGRDAMNSTHPLSTPADNPSQIMEMFDDISYNKGACILHMIRNFLTEEVFQSGLIHYLRKYSYGNAKNEDLWNCLAELHYAEDHMDIKEIMNTWTLQKGLPVIIVEHSGSSVRIQQERFLTGILPEDPSWAKLQSGYIWHIPLTYITSDSQAVGRHLLKTKSDHIELESEAQWIKFNVDLNGYYIVHYTNAGWDALINLLNQNHTLLSQKDRVNLIHDAFQLVSAGKLSLDRALNLTRYLNRETENIAIVQGLDNLGILYKKVEKRNITDVATNLKNYILKFFKHLIDKQSWDDAGTISDKMLRTDLLKTACDLEYLPCVQKASDYFNQWRMSDGTMNLPTDVMATVFSVGAQSSDGWDYLLTKYMQSFLVAEGSKIMYALASSRNPDKLAWLLELALQGDVIKLQNLARVVLAVSRNPYGQQLAWNFVKENWNKLIEKFQLVSPAVRQLIVGSASQFSSREELEEVETFFDSIKEQSSQLKSVQIALETIKNNIRWLDRNLGSLRGWLQHAIVNP